MSCKAYIVAARRSANGRVGGLHRARRLEDLAAPIVVAVLDDANIDRSKVDGFIVGNASAGGNPARLIALTAGLPQSVPAYSIDRQCASGLDAILAAVREIEAGDADIIVAGGAESLSTAPWRIAKPRNLYQVPRFLNLSLNQSPQSGELEFIEVSEALAKHKGIDRARQDAYAMVTCERAARAQQNRCFVGEIVPMRLSPGEALDEPMAHVRSADELSDLPTYLVPEGTITPGNSSAMNDGAAFVIVVSKAIYDELEHPPAIRLVAGAAIGSSADEGSPASVAALHKIYNRLNGFDRTAIGVFELGETSAVEAIALEDELGLAEGLVNPDGGSIAHGLPYGASGAVLVTRLFSRLVRQRNSETPKFGAAVTGAQGGLGLAALFEAV